MTPLQGAAVLHLLGDETGADARAEEDDHRVVTTPAGAEPQLGLAERAGTVVDEVRDGVGEFTGRTQQGLERDGVPAHRLAVHHRALPRGAGHDAGDSDAECGDAELELSPGTLNLRIPDDLRSEIEVEIGNGEIELEIEFKWPTAQTRKAPSRTVAATKKATGRKNVPAKPGRSSTGTSRSKARSGPLRKRPESFRGPRADHHALSASMDDGSSAHQRQLP